MYNMIKCIIVYDYCYCYYYDDQHHGYHYHYYYHGNGILCILISYTVYYNIMVSLL